MDKIKFYWDKLDPKIQHYLESACISFLSGFIMVLAANIDHLSFESLKDGSYVGILILALRTGTKLAWDVGFALLAYLRDKYSPKLPEQGQ